MSLVNDLENKKFDIRLLDWNLKNNRITQSEYDKMIGQLEDRKNQSETVVLTNLTDDNDSEMDASPNNGDYPLQ